MSAGVLPPGPEATLPGDRVDGPPAAGDNEPADGPPADGPSDGPAAGDNEPADGPPAAGAIILPDGPPAGDGEAGVLVDGAFATGDVAGVVDPPVAGDGGDTFEPVGVGDEVGVLPVGVDIGAPAGDGVLGVDDPLGEPAVGEVAEGADGVPGVDDPVGGAAAGEEAEGDEDLGGGVVEPPGGVSGDPEGDGVVGVDDPLLGGAATGAGVLGAGGVVVGGLPWFLTDMTTICNFCPLPQLSLLPLMK